MSGLVFKPVVANPELRDLLLMLKKDIFLSFNCHAIATVQSVNVADQTLTATINYSQSQFDKDSATGEFAQSDVPYPILLDIPFLILSGGGAVLTFPIKQGDECLVFFNDRDLDNWFSGATSGPVNSNRLHSLSDGIALVGLFPSIASYDADNVILDAGDALIGIQNDVTTLKTLLFELISAINAMTVTVPGITPGVSVATGTVSGIPGSVNSDISALLK